MSANRRPYHQVARAAAADELRERILAAFRQAFLTGWLDDITLDAVALMAKTTRRTVIRLFGGKEGLLKAVHDRMTAEIAVRRIVIQGNPGEAVRVLVSDYEAIGDHVIRMLFQEARWPVLSELLNFGRQWHRDWVTATFGPLIQTTDPAARTRRIDQLIAATDLYTWKLLRRDFERSVEQTEAIMAGTIRELLKEGEAEP